MLKLKHLLYLSVGGFSIAVVATVEMNNVSGVFKFLGATDKQISWLWLIPPTTGLFIQPILGQFSDLVETRYGKRTPFIFIGMIFSVLALLLLTFANTLFFSVIGVLILSCSINCVMEGLRSLIGDIAPNSQQAIAFAWQTVAAGLGSMLASIIPQLLDSLHIFASSGPMLSKVPIIIKLAFFSGAIILFQGIWAMLREVKETDFKPDSTKNSNLQNVTNYFILFFTLWHELYLNLKNMPKVIKRLFLIQIFTWSSIFCIFLYFGIAISQHVFNLPVGVKIDGNSSYQILLTRGIIESGICFAIYQFVTILYGLCLPKIVKKISPYKVHAISLLIGALSLISIIFLHSLWLIHFSMIGFGIAYGSLSTLPYSLIAAEISREKMGAYFGIFNITITIPQILCGFLIGFINNYIFMGHAIFSILLSGILMGTAGIILLRQEGINILGFFSTKKYNGS